MRAGHLTRTTDRIDLKEGPTVTRLLGLTASPYGVFLAGPSATGDIEGVIIHGAQGARSLTVLLLAPSGVEALGL